jgi:hypothetical protein
MKSLNELAVCVVCGCSLTFENGSDVSSAVMVTIWEKFSIIPSVGKNHFLSL